MTACTIYPAVVVVDLVVVVVGGNVVVVEPEVTVVVVNVGIVVVVVGVVAIWTIEVDVAAAGGNGVTPLGTNAIVTRM